VKTSYVSFALAVAWRNLHNYFTNPGMILPGLFFPLFFFIAFAGGLSAARDIPGFDFPSGYTAFQYVFVFLQSAAFSGVFNGFSIARDFESGFAKRFLLAAPNRSAIIVGYTMAAMCRWGFNALVVTVVALIAGMDVDGSGLELFGLVLLGILFNLAGTLWSAGIALRARTVQAGPAMQTPVFLLLFIAPVFVPLSLLAGWIHAVARYNPVTYLLEAGRGFISGHPVEVGLAFGLLFALLAALTVWGLRGLRKAETAG
jgi:ABC-type multidrug transport system permease subunit